MCVRASQFHVDYEHFMALCYVWALLLDGWLLDLAE